VVLNVAIVQYHACKRGQQWVDELAILEKESLSPPKTQKEKWLYLWTQKHEKTFNNPSWKMRPNFTN
jgi:hypothetical protein